jgi:hypothetical protein
MTRAEAIDLARKYDGEFPDEFIDDMMAYLGMDRAELDRTIDLHRNPEIWAQEGGRWRLRYPVV